MSVLIANGPVTWAAEVAHVREVSLLGAADLAYWTDRLREEGLTPAEKDGLAQVLIIAADLRWWGLRFQELSFSVLVNDGRQDASYLLYAYNSRSLLAFCERLFFSTPYHYGDVRVTTAPPAVRLPGAFEAAMDATGREPSGVGEEGYQGPVYLPRKPGQQGNLFVARLSGRTRTYPFVAGRDALTVRPVADVLRALLDSRYAPAEWAVREDATHAKSKTYRRDALLSQPAG